MSNGIRNLSRYWSIKSNQILNGSQMSLAKKLLAYKIFLRPMLIYNWFQRCDYNLKCLEVQALKRIFPSKRGRTLYERYTDLDVTKYTRVQAIRWSRVTGSCGAGLRRMLNTLSKTAADPSPYFTRAADREKNYCQPRSINPTRTQSTSTNSDTSSTMTGPRRSRRLADKKRCQHCKR